MAQVFGLDLGTTNSLAAFVASPDEREARTYLDGSRPHPSVVWYRGSEVIVGRAARDQLDRLELGVVGDFVRSPKGFLGTGSEIHVGGVARDPSSVVAEIIKHVKRDVEGSTAGQVEFSEVVATVPVGMDGRGRRDLRMAAREAGVEIRQFVHEPLAALYGYLRQLDDHAREIASLEGKKVLVFDWGGGTLDLTLCQVTGGSIVQVHNVGDSEVGGDRFDERIVRLLEERHRSENGLRDGYEVVSGAKSKLGTQCENAKIALSNAPSHQVLIGQYSVDGDSVRPLESEITKQELEACCMDLIEKGLSRIDGLLEHVGVRAESIDLCLATGGMTLMPAIRDRLVERFGGPGRVPRIANGDQIIAQGAAWIAFDKQPLTLAKPLELLHANNAYVTLLEAEVELPGPGQSPAATFSMYCTDPRDGFARFLFARPALPGRTSDSDDRDPYGVIMVGVDPEAGPLKERIDLTLAIDFDLVAKATVKSSLFGDVREKEFPNLEFGLKLGGT